MITSPVARGTMVTQTTPAATTVASRMQTTADEKGATTRALVMARIALIDTLKILVAKILATEDTKGNLRMEIGVTASPTAIRNLATTIQTLSARAARRRLRMIDPGRTDLQQTTREDHIRTNHANLNLIRIRSLFSRDKKMARTTLAPSPGPAMP